MIKPLLFGNWIQLEKLFPNVPSEDEGSERPTKGNTVEEIKSYLKLNNISFTKKATKSALLKLVEE